MNALFQSSWLRLLLPGAFLVLALGWLFNVPIGANLRDHVIARAYFEDFKATDSIESVIGKTFKPFDGPLFLGNQQRPLWLKLTITPSSDPSLVLHFQSTQTHHVDVWSMTPGGGWQWSQVGTRHAFSQRDPALLSLVTRIVPDPASPSIVYARVVSPTTPIHVQILSERDAAEFDGLLHLITGLFVGMGLLLVGISAAVWAVTREPLWGLDAVVNAAGLFLFSVHLGLAAKLIWPDAENWINLLCLYGNLGYLVLVSLFFDRLLRLYELPAWYRWTYWAPLLLLPVQFVFIHEGRFDLALNLNNALILLQTLWSVIILVRMRHPDTFMLAAYRVFNVGLVAYIIWWGLGVVLRQQTGNLSTLYPMLPTSLFTMVMLLLILMRHTQLRMQAAQRLHVDKLSAEQQLRFEQQRHEETSSFLGMVLHEVKSPLNYIRMATSNLQAEAVAKETSAQQRLQRIHESVDTIDTVLQRAIDVDHMEQNGFVVRSVATDVEALLQRMLLTHAARDRLSLEGVRGFMADTDPDLLLLMLRNLIENALKYSPPESIVSLGLRRLAINRWCFETRNPVGAAGHPDPARLFRKFYRAPGASRQSGMGLGLYWVHGVASRMGGDIRYASQGVEVVFTLCLPG